jgi:hypothetical protein
MSYIFLLLKFLFLVITLSSIVKDQREMLETAGAVNWMGVSSVILWFGRFRYVRYWWAECLVQKSSL